MNTVLVLSNHDIRAIVGTTMGRKIIVKKACHAFAPEGSVIDGQIIDVEAFTEFIKQFFQENKLPAKNIHLVLGSARSVTRRIELPNMPEKKVLECLAREFASVERTVDPVYGYVQLAKQGSKMSVLASVVERDFLVPHVNDAKALKSKLSSIQLATATQIKATELFPYIQGGVCVVQVIDGMSLLNLLFVNGKYLHFTRTRVFGERGTPAFGIESARTINNLQQFLKTQQIDEDITRVYMGGECEPSDFDVCRESMTQMDAALEVQMLWLDPTSGIVFPEGVEFSRYVSAIGALLNIKGRNNYLYQLKHNPQAEKRKKEIIYGVLPAAVSFLIGGVATFALMGIVSAKQNAVDQQLSYLQHPDVIRQVAEYDQLSAQEDGISAMLTAIRTNRNHLESYPIFSTRVGQLIDECAQGVVGKEITSYDAVSGKVDIEVTASEADEIHQFVERLASQYEMFIDVDYSGFEYEEKSGVWKTTVNAYMRGAQVVEQEVQS